MPRRPRSLAALVVLALCFRALPALAQVPFGGLGAPSASPADTAVAPLPRAFPRGGVLPDVTRADSPRGAAVGYLAATRAGDYRRATNYLDPSNLSAEDTTTERLTVLARQLKFVLDRTLWIDVEAVSDHPDGDLEDGLSPDRERLGTISTRKGPVEIRLRRDEEADGRNKTWRFSPVLVQRIPELYSEFGPGPIGARMPPAMYTPRFLEVELWQWIALAIAAAIAYGAAMLLVTGVMWLLRFRATRKRQSFDDELLATIRLPARLVVALGIFLALSLFLLRLSIPARTVLVRITEIFLVILITWAFIKLADRLWSRVRARLEMQDRRSTAALALLGERLTRVVLIALGAIVALQQLGFRITGLVAGLGVGGVAVALAAQKTIANLFGGFSLATDQPVRLGDFCKFGDKSGWVEDVGMRSTRIRTLDRTLITVPNSEFAEIQLENLSMRDRMRLAATLGLRYETTPDQMRRVLMAVHKLLAEDQRVIQDPLRVRFAGFGAYSLDIEVFTYISTADLDEFMAIREEIFLKIMDVVKDNGTSFAFPSQTIYNAEDSPYAPVPAAAPASEATPAPEAAPTPAPAP